jgi:alginate O-acetyltransferase complex protein AlgI
MDRLKDIFMFSEEYPLIFTQINFWIFFAIVFAGYSVVYKRFTLRSVYLLLISLFFYYKTSGLFLLILIFSTLNDYFLGGAVYKSNNNRVKLGLVSLSVVINLSILFYFKYAYFFTESFNEMFGTQYNVVNYLGKWANDIGGGDYFTVDKILLPVGISFYTFQTISYSVDIYRKQLEPVRNIVDFGFYVSFFPQLVAGPIVRAKDFIPQLYAKYNLTKAEFGWAMYMILKGLVKKIVVADYIAINFIDRIFQDPMAAPGSVNMFAMFAYSLQIYCDFSGYTDIAIGLAKTMGFDLTQNFNSPYKAKNVADFWRRWHMSLSAFLRDYLYIPLGGNKKGTIASYICIAVIVLFTALITHWYMLMVYFVAVVIVSALLVKHYPWLEKYFTTDMNLLITMLFGGLWHGASMNFLIWGGLNGIALVVYKHWKRISPYENINSIPSIVLKIAITFTFITFTRIFFRLPDFDSAMEVIYQVINNFDISVVPRMLTEYAVVFIIMATGLIIHWLPDSFKDKVTQWFVDLPLSTQAVIMAVSGILIYQSVSSDFAPFVYFQF